MLTGIHNYELKKVARGGSLVVIAWNLKFNNFVHSRSQLLASSDKFNQ
jgi:hypothetical protein